MRQNFKLLIPTLGLLALVWWGCESKVPALGYIQSLTRLPTTRRLWILMEIFPVFLPNL